jgi:hypothetical protein
MTLYLLSEWKWNKAVKFLGNFFFNRDMTNRIYRGLIDALKGRKYWLHPSFFIKKKWLKVEIVYVLEYSSNY